MGAVNQLVLDLKAASLWSKFHALYPFVGGTADTHKFNLKDPRNLDAAYRLTYHGAGVTHSNFGMTPKNLPLGYAQTYFVPLDNLPTASSQMSYYSRTQILGSHADMGNYGSTKRQHLLIGWGSGLFYYGQMDPGAVSVANPNTQGLFCGSRTDASSMAAYRNGTQIATSTAAAIAQGGEGTWIGGISTYTVGGSSRQCAFASISEGLDATENADLYTAVQTFQTTLGRQV